MKDTKRCSKNKAKNPDKKRILSYEYVRRAFYIEGRLASFKRAFHSLDKLTFNPTKEKKLFEFKFGRKSYLNLPKKLIEEIKNIWLEQSCDRYELCTMGDEWIKGELRCKNPKYKIVRISSGSNSKHGLMNIELKNIESNKICYICLSRGFIEEILEIYKQYENDNSDYRHTVNMHY